MSGTVKEIGGYFGLETFSGTEHYGDLIGVNSARNALLYVMKAKNIKKLFVPHFLCDSVAELCRREGYDLVEYHIDKDFMPVFDHNLAKDEYLYIVNYYGQISNDQLLSMKKRWGNVILDNVQAFFQKPVAGVDTIYSCRKFFGVPDGAYLASDTKLPMELEVDFSRDRMSHLLGRFEVSGSAFFSDFQANDDRFAQMPLRRMSALTQNFMRALDYEAVRTTRNENYHRLEDSFGFCNRLSLAVPDGPYCYPFWCENGMAVKRVLAEKKIYVPTLWPNVLVSKTSSQLEKDFAANILPLPCDQRYDAEDIKWMSDVLRQVLCDMGERGSLDRVFKED